MKKKRNYEEENKKELPDILKFLILVGAIILMFIGINAFCNYTDKIDMENIYSEQTID